MKFITSIYNGLHHTEYGGRLNRDNHYLYSIKSLSNLKEDIICYTSEEDRSGIQSYLNDNNITNITLKIFELASMQYHKQIRDIKIINKELYAQDNVWAHRCVEIMWLKLEWIHQAAIDYPNEKIMWIDAGISHGGIIPKKYNVDPTISGYENSFQFKLAFNEKLVEKLDKLSNDKIFTFYCNNRQHNYPDLFIHDYRLPGSICAGIFGGNKEQIEKLYNAFDSVIKYIISHNTLMQEEMMLTLIYQEMPELFNIYDFDTWYHPDWDCYNPELKSFSQFFEDLM